MNPVLTIKNIISNEVVFVFLFLFFVSLCGILEAHNNLKTQFLNRIIEGKSSIVVDLNFIYPNCFLSQSDASHQFGV